jgi:Helix-hairpin-helix motif
MAKANVNTASRDELVDAGVRAELADEIVKLRRKGKVRLEALDELPGVGRATLEDLRKTLDFSDLAQVAAETVRGVAPSTNAAAEAGRTGLHLARRAAGETGEAQRELTHRTVDSTAEFGRELTDLLQEQARHNLRVWSALGAADWSQLWQLQAEYLRASLERTAQLTRRWLALSQAALTASTGTTREQGKRVA